MPQKKSAAKAYRQSLKRQDRNYKAKKAIKDLRKKIQKALAGKKQDEAEKLFMTFQKAVDKAAKSGGFMHQNTAGRYKANIRKAIKKLKQTQA